MANSARGHPACRCLLELCPLQLAGGGRRSFHETLAFAAHSPAGNFTNSTGTSTLRSTLRLTLPKTASSILPRA